MNSPETSQAPRRLAEQRARARLERQIRAARTSVPAFIEFVLRDEFTDLPLKNKHFHNQWQAFFDEHPMAVLLAPVGHAKTQQTVGRILFLLGQNPNVRIALIGNTSTQAEKVLRAIRGNIERNPRLAQVFPNLKRSERPEDLWHASQLTVQRPTISLHSSVQAVGVFGPINGSRLEYIVADDLVDFENSQTPEQRQKLIEWWDLTVMSRLYQDGRISLIGTPWDQGDLLHTLASRPGWATSLYSAVENPDDNPAEWRPIWPEKWSKEALLARLLKMTPVAFARTYMCRVLQDATSRFKREWIDRMIGLGRGWAMHRATPKAQGGVRKLACFTGVDLGVGEGKDNGLTCIFTIAALDNGRVLVCEVQSGRWHAAEIIDRLGDVYQRFNSRIMVESNGAQQFLVQMASDRFPVTGQVTNKYNKFSEELGVEVLAVEMRNGMWLAPSGQDGKTLDPEVRAWIGECETYQPAAHTGDRLMASWLARCAMRQMGAPQTVTMDVQRR